MRVRGNPRNGEAAMFPRAVWTYTCCPVALGMSGVSAIDKTSQFRGYSACIPYIAITGCPSEAVNVFKFTVSHPHNLSSILPLVAVGNPVHAPWTSAKGLLRTFHPRHPTPSTHRRATSTNDSSPSNPKSPNFNSTRRCCSLDATHHQHSSI